MSSLSGSAQSAALCLCQNLLFATVGISLLSYREKQTHRFPNCRCILYNKTQSSTVILTFQWSKHKRIPQSWFSLIWNNIYVNMLLVCWVRCRSCDSKDFLSDREYIQNLPPSAPSCTCRHSVGYCLMRMRISLYQGKHWCSSAIVLIVSPRFHNSRLIVIYSPLWVSVPACVCLCWVSVYRCSCTWPLVPIFAFRHANMRPRHFRPDASNCL